MATAASLLVVQHLLPLGRASEVLWDLLGISIAEATITTQMQRAAALLEPVEQQIKAALIQAEVLHQDESSVRVAGQRWWLHVSATPTLTHYAVHAKRGQEALDAIDILPHFRGRSLHDGFGSYWLYECEHALCNVHNRPRAICSIVSACTRRRRWPSCRICACLSTIPRPSVTFA